MTSQEFLLQTEEEIAQKLGKRAKALRIKKNITQKDFAKKAGLVSITYGKFERTGVISFVGFLKVLRYLGKLKDISELLSAEDIETLGIKAFVKQNTKIQRQRVSGSIK